VTAWRRVGVQTSGNLIVYDDALGDKLAQTQGQSRGR
jgi:hypothetical protein